MYELHGWYIKRYYGGGGKAPAAPDYRGAAVEQAAASREATAQQNYANRPTLTTPWGQQTWQTGSATDPGTGTPVTTWSSNVSLTPEQQSSLTAQQDITATRSAGAQTLANQAVGNFQTPFNWSSLPTAPGQAAQPVDISGAQQGAFAKMSAMLEPGRTRALEGLDTKLANMGLTRNSEAWNRAHDQLQSQWTQEDKSTLAQALAEGRMDAGAQYGMTAQTADQQQRLRQQAIAEEAQRRGMTLNELNALLTGQQVSMPQMPSFAPASKAEAPNLLGAAQAQGQYNLSSMNDWGSGLGGIASVAGAVAPYVMGAYSDRRLKSGIKRVGTHSLGVGIYEFVMFGVKQVGVIAQELMRVRPDLVFCGPSGYLMVNYGGL